MPSQHANEFTNGLIDLYKAQRDAQGKGDMFDVAFAEAASDPQDDAITYDIGVYTVTLCPANAMREINQPEHAGRYIALGANECAEYRPAIQQLARISLYVPTDEENQVLGEIWRNTAFRLPGGLLCHNASRELNKAESALAVSLMPLDARKIHDPRPWSELGALNIAEQDAYSAAKTAAEELVAISEQMHDDHLEQKRQYLDLEGTEILS